MGGRPFCLSDEGLATQMTVRMGECLDLFNYQAQFAPKYHGGQKKDENEKEIGKMLSSDIVNLLEVAVKR